jgi:hypothetical protein
MNIIFIEATDNLFTKPYIYGRKSKRPDDPITYLIESFDDISKYFEKIPGTKDLYSGKVKMRQYLKPFMVIGNYLFQKVKDRDNIYQRIDIQGQGQGAIGAGTGAAGTGAAGIGAARTGAAGTGVGASTGISMPQFITIKETKDKDGKISTKMFGNKELIAKYKKNPNFYKKTEIGTGIYYDKQKKKYILRGNPNNKQNLPYFVIPQRLSQQNYNDVIDKFLKQLYGDKPVFTSTYKQLKQKYQAKNKLLEDQSKKLVNMVIDSYSWDGKLYATNKKTGISSIDNRPTNIKFFLIRVNLYVVPEKASMRERMEMSCIYHRNKIQQIIGERKKQAQSSPGSKRRYISVVSNLPKFSSGRYRIGKNLLYDDDDDYDAEWYGSGTGEEEKDSDSDVRNKESRRKKAAIKKNYGYNLGSKYDDSQDTTPESGKKKKVMSSRARMFGNQFKGGNSSINSNTYSKTRKYKSRKYVSRKKNRQTRKRRTRKHKI